MNPQNYGWSRGAFWIRTESGRTDSYRTEERFRYALRNEQGCRPGMVEQIVVACKDARHNATRCECGGKVPHEMNGGYICPVALHNDGGSV